MSISVIFNFYDENFNFIRSERVSGTWNPDELTNLNYLYRQLKLYCEDDFIVKYKMNNWRYAIPNEVKEYMFDLRTGQLLPTPKEIKI